MKKFLLTILSLLPILTIAAQDTPVEPLYTAVGQVVPTEGWGDTAVPTIDNVAIEAYEEYVVIRGFAGVEGYDMMVGFNDNDNVTFVASIVDGVEGDHLTKGYCDIPTGREDVAKLKVYLAKNYCYAGLYEDESGYALLSCYWGDDWCYYNCVWPVEEEGEWTNPFEAEATLLYSTKGNTTEMTDEDTVDDESWGPTTFPEIKGINIDVYDTYIYIKDVAGVEGHGAKVAYNADSEVLSIMPVENGVDGEPCKTYAYISTGIDQVATIQAYPDYSYAQSYEDKSGYVLLAAYLYDAKDNSEWNYYYLVWNEETASISNITVPVGTTMYFDLKGMRVERPTAGNVYLRVADGKVTKVIVQ